MQLKEDGPVRLGGVRRVGKEQRHSKHQGRNSPTLKEPERLGRMAATMESRKERKRWNQLAAIELAA